MPNYEIQKSGEKYKKLDEFINYETTYTYLKLVDIIHDCKLGFTKKNLDKLKIPTSITKKAIFTPDDIPGVSAKWFWQ